jgi:hypothetical protein
MHVKVSDGQTKLKEYPLLTQILRQINKISFMNNADEVKE